MNDKSKKNDVEPPAGNLLHTVFRHFNAETNPSARVFLYVLLIFLIVVLLFQNAPSFFLNLARVDFARGVITFIIALSTMVIALTLAFSAMTGRDDETERFTKGKDILTIMLGILGTIIGYYYGTVEKDKLLLESLEITEISVSPAADSLKPNSDVTFLILLKDGNPPFDYSIAFDEGFDGQNVERKKSYYRWIKEHVVFPKDGTGAVSFHANVTVTDSGSISAKKKLDLRCVD